MSAWLYEGYTALRRLATLVWSEAFGRIEDAVAAERQIKGWRRDKKEALIRRELALRPSLSRRKGGAADPWVRPSRRGLTGRSSG